MELSRITATITEHPTELPGFIGTMQPSDFPSSLDRLSFRDWFLIL
jgi:hypothetical protein